MNAADKIRVAHELASRFCLRLSKCLTHEEWTELGELTRAETDPSVCHSHDHVDANQVMIDAYGEVTGTEWDCSDLCGELCDAAWDLAKLKFKEIQA